VNFFNENLSIILNRWPELAKSIENVSYDLAQIQLVEDKQLSIVFDNIQLASSHNQQAEAEMQMQSIAIDCPTITVYGTSVGILQIELLQRSALNQLNVVILNLSVFKASLQYFDHRQWLLDSRVNLVVPTSSQMVSSPFIALPAELVLASNESSQVRDRVCLALDHNFINMDKGYENVDLQRVINNNISYIEQDKDVSELYETNNSSNFIICGAGPTLEYSFTWLKNTLTKGRVTLVAVDAAVKSLADIGVIPDIIVSIDPAGKRLLETLNRQQFKNIPLVYFPVVDNDFLGSWSGPRYTTYSTGKLYDAINKKYPKQRLYCAGSVIHPAIDLAVKMGAKKLLLLGADFSFPDGKTHTFWHSDNYSHLPVEQTNHWVLNGYGERVPTLLNYRGYLRDLEQYIKITEGVEFFNGSKKGALIEGTTQWPSSHDF